MTKLSELEADTEYMEAVKHGAQRAFDTATIQSVEAGEDGPEDWKSFAWGFWLGAAYQKLEMLHVPDYEDEVRA